MTRSIVQSLWIGPRLSKMEQVSICSFLHHGHDFHLYCYEPIEGIPEGTTVRDAAEILPPSEVFFYKRGFGVGSPAAFSNMFRYMLLMKRGNWWVDTDVVCLKPFDVPGEHLVAQERTMQGGVSASNAIMRAPPDSDLAQQCYQYCLSIDRDKLKWGVIGPRLVDAVVRELGMETCFQPPSTFCPIDYWRIGELFEARPVPSHSHAVHLWHAMWNWQGIDPDGVFPPDCLWEQLRRQYLPNHETPQLSQTELEFLRRRLAKVNGPPRVSVLKRLRHRLRLPVVFGRRAA